MQIALTVLVIIASYLFGNINFAVLYSKLKGKDIRTLGSGNPGAMNMIRNFGKPLGAITLISEMLKGVIPCLFGWFILGEKFSFGNDRSGLYIGAISVIIGHIFPVFFKFKGGKGIASSIGICLVINPLATIISFAMGFLFIQFTTVGSLGSFIITGIPMFVDGYLNLTKGGNLLASIILFLLFVITLAAHRKNIKKLFLNTESKTKLYGKKKKA